MSFNFLLNNPCKKVTHNKILSESNETTPAPPTASPPKYPAPFYINQNKIPFPETAKCCQVKQNTVHNSCRLFSYGSNKYNFCFTLTFL